MGLIFAELVSGTQLRHPEICLIFGKREVLGLQEEINMTLFMR
jgi:hypothetical protein